MSKKLPSSPAPAGADRLGAQPDKPFEIPPPPATGGTHVWSDTLGIWETLEETVQPWDERHPDNQPPVPAPAKTPLKDA